MKLGEDLLSRLAKFSFDVGEVLRSRKPSQSAIVFTLLLPEGTGRMNAEEYRRKAQQFFDPARQMSHPQDKATLSELATFWMAKAEEANQTQPKNSA